MTFGEQNSLLQSFQLLDQAFDPGINFFHSAEMYPVPQRNQTQGRSEEYLGIWIKDRNIARDRLVLATKLYYRFRETDYDPIRQYDSVPIEEQLNALSKAVDAGKLRYIGLSNETTYGVMKFIRIAEKLTELPKIITLQDQLIGI